MKAAKLPPIKLPPLDPGPIGRYYREAIAACIPSRAHLASYRHAGGRSIHAPWDSRPAAKRERRGLRTDYLKKAHATAWLIACEAAKVPSYWTGDIPLPSHWPILPVDSPEAREDARIRAAVRKHLLPALDECSPFVVAAHARWEAVVLARVLWLRYWLERLAYADAFVTASVWGIQADDVPVIRSAIEALIHTLADVERLIRDPHPCRVEPPGPCWGVAVELVRKRWARSVLQRLAKPLARPDPPSATAWRPLCALQPLHPLCDDEGLSVTLLDATEDGLLDDSEAFHRVWSFAYRPDWQSAKGAWIEAVGQWIGQCVRSVLCDAAGVPLPPRRSLDDDLDGWDTWKRGIDWSNGILVHNLWWDVRIALSRGLYLPAFGHAGAHHGPGRPNEK